jgi:hypothetical protein
MFTAILFYYTVVCSITRPYTEPIARGILAHLYKVSILVALEALYDSAFPYKRLAVV